MALGFDPKSSTVTIKEKPLLPGDNTTPAIPNNILHPNGVNFGVNWNLSGVTWNAADEELVETAVTGGHAAVYVLNSVPAGVVEWRVDATAISRDWILINAGVGGANNLTWFNVRAGTVGTNAAGSTATITQVSQGVYRCSVKRTVATPTTGAFGIQLATANNAASYAGTAGWGVALSLPYFGLA